MEQYDRVLHIAGMRCGDCVRKVAEALLGVEGVADAEVSLEDGRAEVLLSELGPASEQALIEAVDESGFTVERLEPGPAAA